MLWLRQVTSGRSEELSYNDGKVVVILAGYVVKKLRDTMQKISKARNEIADYWHKSLNSKSPFSGDDEFTAFYTSKFLIQDTSESISSHMHRGFSPDPMFAYLEFWGVMQALIIQQDAVYEMHLSLIGQPPKVAIQSAWSQIRDLRNKCAGHPAKKRASGSHYRTFMGRKFGDYTSLTYEQYDSASQKRTHPSVNLKKLIEEYDTQAATYLLDVLNELKKKLP